MSSRNLGLIKRCVLTLMLMAAPLAVYAETAKVKVESVTLRAPLPGQTIAVVYFKLSNVSAQTLTLIGASASWARKLEIHEHQHSDGMMRMRQLTELQLPAGDELSFKPGSYHLMAFDFDLQAYGGEPQLSLQFAADESVLVLLPKLER